MKKKTFLRKVAEYYCDTYNIEDYCFVFPNRRSGEFFEKELAECFNSAHIMPCICTLPELLEQLTDKVKANPIDSIFTLYQAYSEVMGDNAGTMDHFIYWANIIINDFNDVDMALADPKAIYSNVNDLREIATDYIDTELKQEIQRIFNIQFNETNGFWKNRSVYTGDNSPQEQYFTLWEKLYEIYVLYNKLLEQRGQATLGNLYRNAAQNTGNLKWRYSRIVIVGFAALSISEDHIFKAIKEMGGHFWWDLSAQEFDSAGNNGLNLVKFYSKRYPSPIELNIPEATMPKVCTMAVPSGVGQAKWTMYVVSTIGKYYQVFHALSLLFYNDSDPIQPLPLINLNNAIGTAIVLPDVNLLEPIINSIPQGIEHMNVTMGYPMRNAGITSLMHLVARAHRQATLSNGKWMYYRETVLDILSHPIVKRAFTSHTIRLQQDITDSKEFNVSEETFAGTPLQYIFTTVRDLHNKGEVLAFIDNLITFAHIVDLQMRDASIQSSDDAEGSNDNTLPLQSAFINHFIATLKQLRTTFDSSNSLPSEDTSIFYLIDRATSSITIPFTGEPLEGLQVMGMLETRCLDFNNVVIASMNERIFPTRRANSSFIPDMIRNAYSLPTNSLNDATTTYYFYRLLSNANFAILIYDSSTQSYGSGEPSRYISQIEKVYHLPICKIHVNTEIVPSSELGIEVGKTKEIAQMWSGDGENKKSLSASAINGFINCPLQFYFNRIQGFNNDNETSDFMDAATLGNIVHNVLQTFYYPDSITDGKPNIITTKSIDEFKRNHLNKCVIQEINKEYFNKDGQHINDPLKGDAFILHETINTFITNALDYDYKLIEQNGPITVLECEKSHLVDINIDGTKFHFNYKIDRLDKVGNMLRVVDYKTGSDTTEFKSVPALFEAGKGFKRPHAILQLLLYCNAWHMQNTDDKVIQPVIYKLRDMSKTGIYYCKEQYIFTPDDEVNKEFLAYMKNTIDDLQNTNTPFRQTKNKDNCTKCRFADFCRR